MNSTITKRSAAGAMVETTLEDPQRVSIYLAGPIDSSGRTDLNRPTFDRAALELRRKGFCVYNPFDGVKPGETRNEIQKRNFRYLVACDWIVFLPNYINSPGCAAEAACAIECGLGVFDIDEILHEWHAAKPAADPVPVEAARVNVPLLVGAAAMTLAALLFVFVLVQYWAK